MSCFTLQGYSVEKHFYGSDPPKTAPTPERVLWTTGLRVGSALPVLCFRYTRTGFFWEQYDDKTGQGRRSHPFTGWTALILAIMAEEY